ncbi:MAG TPA: hypothetical protein DCX89_04410 [Saprospirales bacterium]|nr:hypothetical protein [Saprospirales bacterium]HRQ30070.1 hypothetical protein [Saprospiraceae bacterium]
MDFFNIMPYFLLIVSLFFIWMGLYVFLLRKPLILNSIWMLVLIGLSMLPIILSTVVMFFESPSIISALPFLMFVVLLIWYVFILKGYTILGVNGSDFQKRFIECLEDHQYVFEQSFSTLKIKDPEIEMSIGVQSWLGTAQIRSKSKANREVLLNLISDLKRKDIRTNYLFPIFYIIIGLLISILSISLMIP